MASKIDIESLKDSINIVDVISEYADLERTGHNSYKAKCPHPQHDDKTPSFHIRGDKGFFKCFGGGCDFKGDVITFIEEMEQIDFIEAVKLLIEEGGLDYEELQTTTTYIREDFNLSKLQKAIELFNDSKTIDESVLDKYRNKHYYLLDRGFKQKTLNYFEIGYCADANDNLYNRVTIPHRDKNGKLVTINGRTTADQKPKYKFYGNTEKSCTLFNIHNIEANDKPIFLTEGELDTIRLHEMGYPRSVAMSGSELEERKWLLKEYTNHVILALDNDEAGVKATRKCVRALYPLVNVSALKLPEDTDVGDIKNKKILDRIIDNTKMFEGGF